MSLTIESVLRRSPDPQKRGGPVRSHSPLAMDAQDAVLRSSTPVRRRSGRQSSGRAASRSRAVDSPRVHFWKRSADVLSLVFLMPFVLPVSILLALYIRCVSPGPVFFRQERVGLGRRRFLMLKFRSMHVGTSQNVHEDHFTNLVQSGQPMRKLDDRDDRLIPLGRLLRASGLDELPQLINVLWGEMTLIGPRPCTAREFERFDPEHWERFNVLPGLTGLWQVSGKNETTFAEMIDLDIAYARRQSPWLDFTIVLRTFPVLWKQVAGVREPGKPSAAGAKVSLLQATTAYAANTPTMEN